MIKKRKKVNMHENNYTVVGLIFYMALSSYALVNEIKNDMLLELDHFSGSRTLLCLFQHVHISMLVVGV